MRNSSKISVLIKVISTILIVSLMVALVTIGFAQTWAKVISPSSTLSSTDINNPMRQLPHPVFSLTPEPAIVQYEGIVTLKWYDTTENAMWFSIEDKEIYEEVCMFVDEHNLPKAMYTYCDCIDMYVRVTMGEETIVKDWYLVDRLTQENIGKPTNEELVKRYELDLKYPIVKTGTHPDVVYLSQLKANTIYSYTPDIEENQDYPVIVNDTGKPCVLYTKHHGLDPAYGAYACPAVLIDEDSVNSFACAFYEAGDEYRIIYTPADNETLCRFATSETINLSDLLEIEDKSAFFMYIYNNTDKEYTLSITRDWEEDPVPFVETLKPGDLIGCWGPSHTFDIKENN